MTDPRPLLICLGFEPKTYDIDFAGIVSNRVYVTWLEDLRLAMLARYMPLPELLAAGTAPTLAETRISYRHPARLLEPIEGRMWVSRLGKTSWEVSAEFVRRADGRLIAEAVQTGVLVDTARGRPARLPESLRREYAAAGGAPAAEARE